MCTYHQSQIPLLQGYLMLLCNNHTYTLSLIFVDHWSVLHCQNFVISKVLYKWNHTVYDLRGFFFFLLRIIIPYKFKLLYMSTIFFFFGAEWCSTICIYYLFNHLPIKWRLGGFQFFTITKKVTVNIYVQVCVWM